MESSKTRIISKRFDEHFEKLSEPKVWEQLCIIKLDACLYILIYQSRPTAIEKVIMNSQVQKIL